MSNPAPFGASQSILAPTLIVHSIERYFLADIVIIAQMSVPETTRDLRVPPSKRGIVRSPIERAPHTRTLIVSKLGEHGVLCRCCDVRPEVDTRNEATRKWNWDVQIMPENPARYPGLAGADAREAVNVAVTRFRLTDGRVVAAQELALFRQRLIDGFRAISTDLVVHGGSWEWDMSWWPNAETS
ncbi:MAG TPA: hypothetical protein VG147_06515 [Solirubrobacteraceae bacterium]|jgi:hypothetical protein|nr:hypothetical protein [Solirubrobacteraceae bacterium]